MLGDLSRVSRSYLVTGYTDMRKSVNGLMAIIRDVYHMDPYSNSLFLFCGRRCDRIKALHFEATGFVLLYKILEKDAGRFSWPRNANEARPLTHQEFKWLMEGLAVDQPKASAIIYSLVETAKMNGLNIFAYLQNVLMYMPGLVKSS